jgi:hypothetical protein
MKDKFSFVMPAEIQKSEDGEWKIAGLASTESMDQQGETIMQKGIDLSPIDQKRGYFNFDHLKGPENLVGTIDGYSQTGNGLYVYGKLFKNHDKAKSVYQIMSSLGKSDTGRVGLSVEGKILKRNPNNPKVIEKCQIDKVAITFNPVNQQTYADLVKSMSGGAEIEFNATEDSYNDEAPVSTYTADQVLSIVEKALGVGAGYTQAPNTLTDGDAMATSDMNTKKKKNKKDESNKADGDTMDKAQGPCWDGHERVPGTKEMTPGSCRKKKKLKKCSQKLYKSKMIGMLDQLQKLYPNNSRTELWDAVKDRMETRFPELLYPES